MAASAGLRRARAIMRMALPIISRASPIDFE
jgi:hypothetical protein